MRAIRNVTTGFLFFCTAIAVLAQDPRSLLESGMKEVE